MMMSLGDDTELSVLGDWNHLSPHGGVREAFAEVTLELSG